MLVFVETSRMNDSNIDDADDDDHLKITSPKWATVKQASLTKRNNNDS